MLLQLFLVFFKIGLFTFGGGYAMIPLIKEEIVEKRKWIASEEMLDIIAIAESTPGPIAINVATYIGYKNKKLLGSICSTLGVILPSLLIIIALSFIYEAFIGNKYVQYAFIGIKCAVAVLILKAGIEMIVKAEKKAFFVVLFLFAITMMLCIELFSWNISSIAIILVGGAAGVVAYALNKKKEGKES